MKKEAWRTFEAAREDHRARCEGWSVALPNLGKLQEELRIEMGYDDYRIETPIVYNAALDEIEPGSDPSFVLVADNPGKKEQLAKNRRNLVGQSGKLAEGFFRRELGLEFRKDVVIINKTPLHTPKTAEIRKLLVIASRHGEKTRQGLETLLAESQAAMARLAKSLHEALGIPLWISGYGELGPRGLFRIWAETLGAEYASAPPRLRETVLLFRHFSMNQFAIEVKQKRDGSQPMRDELERIGKENRRRILGW